MIKKLLIVSCVFFSVSAYSSDLVTEDFIFKNISHYDLSIDQQVYGAKLDCDENMDKINQESELRCRIKYDLDTTNYVSGYFGFGSYDPGNSSYCNFSINGTIINDKLNLTVTPVMNSANIQCYDKNGYHTVNTGSSYK